MPPPAPPSSPLRILVTAGPTREPIDAVRFISNRSSGRMGRALATAAAMRGHRVTLLLGLGSQTPPPETSSAPGQPVAPGGVATHRFDSTADLAMRLDQLWPDHDLLVMAAAVSDHRPVFDPAELAASAGKLSRGNGAFTLHLEPTPDLLAGLARGSRRDQTLIGFALEPAARLEASALEKLRRKGVHGIVANPLETMDASEVVGTLFLSDGRRVEPPEPRLSKERFAAWLIECLEALRAGGP